MGPAPLVCSYPGSPERKNEDRALATETVAVVVDGAGMPASSRTGCWHSVAWYAETLSHALVERLTTSAISMRDALAAALEDTLEAHGPRCRPTEGSPSATVASWRIGQDRLDYLVLGDASVSLSVVGGRTEHVSDHRLNAAVGPAVERVTAAGGSGADLRTARLQAVEETRNQPDGFWCCHHNPDAAREAVTGSRDLALLDGAVLASDGAARGFELLGCHGLTDFVNLAVAGRHESIRETIRSAEFAQSQRLDSLGLKIHDDASIVSLRVGRDQLTGVERGASKRTR